jgi:hypothetical protein
LAIRRPVAELVLGTLAVGISLALKVAFDAYVASRFALLDDDVVGMTPFVWVYVSILILPVLGAASVLRGRVRVRLAGIGMIMAITIWLLIIDNVIGALRDGAVSPAGLTIGALAVAQAALLTAWAAVVWRTGIPAE